MGPGRIALAVAVAAMAVTACSGPATSGPSHVPASYYVALRLAAGLTDDELPDDL